MPANPDLAMPDGLTPTGVTAYRVIVAELRHRRTTFTGGCRAFYSPQEWLERGEQYGHGAALIVVHDGGDLAPYFNWDYCDTKRIEQMNVALNDVRLYAEQCTCWYTAIYPVNQPVQA